MGRFPEHQPPTAAVVAELMRAGLSWTTAMAMERWKAEEVLQLLNPQAGTEMPGGGTTRPDRDTI